MVGVCIGMTFANGWVVREHLNCAQSEALGLGRKNSHWICENIHCGHWYAFENTVIKRWVENGVQTLMKCRSCKPGCYYSKQNYKVIEKEIDRRPLNTSIGTVYGVLTIDGIDQPSHDFNDHHRHVACKCAVCGGRHFMRHDDIQLQHLPCRGVGKSDLMVPLGY